MNNTEKIKINDLDDKFSKLADLKENIYELTYKYHEVENDSSCIISYIEGSKFNFHSVIFDDGRQKEYSEAIINLTLSYISLTINDNIIEYTQKYKELKKICDKIKELDFTNKFEEIKLESSISDFVEKKF